MMEAYVTTAQLARLAQKYAVMQAISWDPTTQATIAPQYTAPQSAHGGVSTAAQGGVMMVPSAPFLARRNSLTGGNLFAAAAGGALQHGGPAADVATGTGVGSSMAIDGTMAFMMNLRNGRPCANSYAYFSLEDSSVETVLRSHRATVAAERTLRRHYGDDASHHVTELRAKAKGAVNSYNSLAAGIISDFVTGGKIPRALIEKWPFLQRTLGYLTRFPGFVQCKTAQPGYDDGADSAAVAPAFLKTGELPLWFRFPPLREVITHTEAHALLAACDNNLVLCAFFLWQLLIPHALHVFAVTEHLKTAAAAGASSQMPTIPQPLTRFLTTSELAEALLAVADRHSRARMQVREVLSLWLVSAQSRADLFAFVGVPTAEAASIDTIIGIAAANEAHVVSESAAAQVAAQNAAANGGRAGRAAFFNQPNPSTTGSTGNNSNATAQGRNQFGQYGYGAGGATKANARLYLSSALSLTMPRRVPGPPPPVPQAHESAAHDADGEGGGPTYAPYAAASAAPIDPRTRSQQLLTGLFALTDCEIDHVLFATGSAEGLLTTLGAALDSMHQHTSATVAAVSADDDDTAGAALHRARARAMRRASRALRRSPTYRCAGTVSGVTALAAETEVRNLATFGALVPGTVPASLTPASGPAAPPLTATSIPVSATGATLVPPPPPALDALLMPYYTSFPLPWAFAGSPSTGNFTVSTSFSPHVTGTTNNVSSANTRRGSTTAQEATDAAEVAEDYARMTSIGNGVATGPRLPLTASLQRWLSYLAATDPSAMGPAAVSLSAVAATAGYDAAAMATKLNANRSQVVSGPALATSAVLGVSPRTCISPLELSALPALPAIAAAAPPFAGVMAAHDIMVASTRGAGTSLLSVLMPTICAFALSETVAAAVQPPVISAVSTSMLAELWTGTPQATSSSSTWGLSALQWAFVCAEFGGSPDAVATGVRACVASHRLAAIRASAIAHAATPTPQESAQPLGAAYLLSSLLYMRATRCVYAVSERRLVSHVLATTSLEDSLIMAREPATAPAVPMTSMTTYDSESGMTLTNVNAVTVNAAHASLRMPPSMAMDLDTLLRSYCVLAASDELPGVHSVMRVANLNSGSAVAYNGSIASFSSALPASVAAGFNVAPAPGTALALQRAPERETISASGEVLLPAEGERIAALENALRHGAWSAIAMASNAGSVNAQNTSTATALVSESQTAVADSLASRLVGTQLATALAAAPVPVGWTLETNPDAAPVCTTVAQTVAQLCSLSDVASAITLLSPLTAAMTLFSMTLAPDARSGSLLLSVSPAVPCEPGKRLAGGNMAAYSPRTISELVTLSANMDAPNPRIVPTASLAAALAQSAWPWPYARPLCARAASSAAAAPSVVSSLATLSPGLGLGAMITASAFAGGALTVGPDAASRRPRSSRLRSGPSQRTGAADDDDESESFAGAAVALFATADTPFASISRLASVLSSAASPALDFPAVSSAVSTADSHVASVSQPTDAGASALSANDAVWIDLRSVSSATFASASQNAVVSTSATGGAQRQRYGAGAAPSTAQTATGGLNTGGGAVSASDPWARGAVLDYIITLLTHPALPLTHPLARAVTVRVNDSVQHLWTRVAQDPALAHWLPLNATDAAVAAAAVADAGTDTATPAPQPASVIERGPSQGLLAAALLRSVIATVSAATQQRRVASRDGEDDGAATDEVVVTDNNDGSGPQRWRLRPRSLTGFTEVLMLVQHLTAPAAERNGLGLALVSAITRARNAAAALADANAANEGASPTTAMQLRTIAEAPVTVPVETLNDIITSLSLLTIALPRHYLLSALPAQRRQNRTRGRPASANSDNNANNENMGDNAGNQRPRPPVSRARPPEGSLTSEQLANAGDDRSTAGASLGVGLLLLSRLAALLTPTESGVSEAALALSNGPIPAAFSGPDATLADVTVLALAAMPPAPLPPVSALLPAAVAAALQRPLSVYASNGPAALVVVMSNIIQHSGDTISPPSLLSVAARQGGLAAHLTSPAFALRRTSVMLAPPSTAGPGMVSAADVAALLVAAAAHARARAALASATVAVTAMLSATAAAAAPCAHAEKVALTHASVSARATAAARAAAAASAAGAPPRWNANVEAAPALRRMLADCACDSASRHRFSVLLGGKNDSTEGANENLWIDYPQTLARLAVEPASWAMQQHEAVAAAVSRTATADDDSNHDVTHLADEGCVQAGMDMFDTTEINNATSADPLQLAAAVASSATAADASALLTHAATLLLMSHAVFASLKPSTSRTAATNTAATTPQTLALPHSLERARTAAPLALLSALEVRMLRQNSRDEFVFAKVPAASRQRNRRRRAVVVSTGSEPKLDEIGLLLDAKATAPASTSTVGSGTEALTPLLGPSAVSQIDLQRLPRVDGAFSSQQHQQRSQHPPNQHVKLTQKHPQHGLLGDSFAEQDELAASNRDESNTEGDRAVDDEEEDEQVAVDVIEFIDDPHCFSYFPPQLPTSNTNFNDSQSTPDGAAAILAHARALTALLTDATTWLLRTAAAIGVHVDAALVNARAEADARAKAMAVARAAAEVAMKAKAAAAAKAKEEEEAAAKAALEAAIVAKAEAEAKAKAEAEAKAKAKAEADAKAKAEAEAKAEEEAKETKAKAEVEAAAAAAQAAAAAAEIAAAASVDTTTVEATAAAAAAAADTSAADGTVAAAVLAEPAQAGPETDVSDIATDDAVGIQSSGGAEAAAASQKVAAEAGAPTALAEVGTAEAASVDGPAVVQARDVAIAETGLARTARVETSSAVAAGAEAADYVAKRTTDSNNSDDTDVTEATPNAGPAIKTVANVSVPDATSATKSHIATAVVNDVPESNEAAASIEAAADATVYETVASAVQIQVKSADVEKNATEIHAPAPIEPMEVMDSVDTSSQIAAIAGAAAPADDRRTAAGNETAAAVTVAIDPAAPNNTVGDTPGVAPAGDNDVNDPTKEKLAAPEPATDADAAFTQMTAAVNDVVTASYTGSVTSETGSATAIVNVAAGEIAENGPVNSAEVTSVDVAASVAKDDGENN